MTREELCKILETFAVAVSQTVISDLDVDSQYALITQGIDNIADSVMICAKRDALRYSVN
jgi:hypothetical protein